MGQHRTKREKEKAVQLRLKEARSESSTPTSADGYTFVAENVAAPQSDTLLRVDSKYIVRDLIKTVSISSILLCVVIGIYFYLRYN